VALTTEVPLIKVTQAQVDGEVMQDVWINIDQMIYMTVQGGVTLIQCRDGFSVQVLETPAVIIAAI
jgi:hypothetical protein